MLNFIKILKRINRSSLTIAIMLSIAGIVNIACAAGVGKLLDQGDNYLNNKNYDNAITAYTQAIAFDPKCVKAYNNRGNVYASIGKYDEAISDYNRALELSPQHINSYSNRGSAFAAKGAYDQAINDYNKAIELNINYWPAYNNRAESYLFKGMYDEAIKDCNKVLGISSNVADTYHIRGNSYHFKGQNVQALSDLNKALQIDSNNAIYYVSRGNTYVELNQLMQAKNDYYKAISMEKGAFNLIEPKNRKLITVNADVGNASMNQLLLKGIAAKDYDLINAALANGANVNIYTDTNQYDTALTASFGKGGITDYLISCGADVNAVMTESGHIPPLLITPLIKAVWKNDVNLVKTLVVSGANVNYAGAGNCRALSEAISHDFDAIVELLLYYNPEVNYMTQFGSPLMLAIRNKNFKEIELLINAGANIKQTDANGKTALDYAIATGNKEIINFFLNRQ